MFRLKSIAIAFVVICSVIFLTSVQAGWETKTKERILINGAWAGVQVQLNYEFPFATAYPYGWIGNFSDQDIRWYFKSEGEVTNENGRVFFAQGGDDGIVKRNRYAAASDEFNFNMRRQPPDRYFIRGRGNMLAKNVGAVSCEFEIPFDR